MSTSIEWTDETWNPIRGCSPISPGCKNCYAEAIAARFSQNFGDSQRVQGPFAGFAIMTDKGPKWTGKVEAIESKFSEPLHWKNPRRVFVNSMSDLFHEKVSYVDILKIFQIMGKCPRHTFQILTKRPGKMRELLSLCWWRNLGHSPEMGGDIWVKVIAGEQREGDKNFLPNVHLGVSIENQPTADARIPELLRTPAAVRFVSYEPALAAASFRWAPWVDYTRIPLATWNHLEGLRGIDWVIIGGESGPGARPFHLEWARNVIKECKSADVAAFMKQLGARPIGESAGDLLYLASMKSKKGGNPAEWPPDLNVREYPR